MIPLLNIIFESVATVDEMAIANYRTIGDFSKADTVMQKIDRDLVTHPKAIEKIKRQWEKTKFNFDIFVINDPRVEGLLEVGRVDKEFLKIRGFSDEELPINQENITIIFTNNEGTAAVPLSGWIMAHRLAHALKEDTERGRTSIKWSYFSSTVQDVLIKAAHDVYGIYKPTPEDKALMANLLGTMKSARENQILRHWEFGYELFAQYLITGKITLKPLDKADMSHQLKDFNKNLYWFTGMMEQSIDEMLGAAVGEIFVM